MNTRIHAGQAYKISISGQSSRQGGSPRQNEADKPAPRQSAGPDRVSFSKQARQLAEEQSASRSPLIHSTPVAPGVSAPAQLQVPPSEPTSPDQTDNENPPPARLDLRV